ncbi:Outer membrane porin protein 32 [Paraburkholderia domus]|jgi:Outer membrane protein (porin)|uniref:Outer membrane porin protein 32 n=1 Tax=Paraburkholderia domus TaxID=2793075 RepID=A0A9N8MKI3_9BURK|nr:porin [Paraburkholderia domus]MBK5049235.1 porin [Burkholderia sp. R-70006]MBK5060204.1 porin [Burkholderia sp. R-70199]MBK5085164.1 porin [Burkholderia sp. R-69927]MBK5118468.1 porin [Burkholderia sp. R-69980]MBK5164306.1 porin [Burkholderia sp. R-70211]MBK5179657.1 porin [Burkholderia sp. R-69749]
MKVKLAALAALAAFASSAYAQSSVTLYGVVDSGLLYQSTSGPVLVPSAAAAAKFKSPGSVFALKDGGIYSSGWGIKGTEDIGGGYKVNFKLQGSFQSTSGALQLSDTPGVSAIFNQYSTIGLSGPFGSFDAGRQIVPMIWAMQDTDVRGAQYFGSILTAWIGMNQAAGWVPTSTNAPIGALYDSNALVYHSPNFHGVTAELEYAPGGVAGQIQGGTRESAVLRYAYNGLHLAAVYYNGHDTNPFAPTATGTPVTPATGNDNNRFYYLGARYQLQGFEASVSYSLGKNPSNSNKANLDLVSGGLGYAFSPQFSISSGIYYLHSKSEQVPGHSTEVSLGADYKISKQTTLYAEVGHVDNRGIMNQMIVYGQFVAPDANTTAAMVGVRHNF